MKDRELADLDTDRIITDDRSDHHWQPRRSRVSLQEVVGLRDSESKQETHQEMR